jgi:hypothetical protein
MLGPGHAIPHALRTVTEVTDEDQDSHIFAGFPAEPEPSRRIPAIVAFPVVLSCALLGYAINLVTLPHSPQTAVQPAPELHEPAPVSPPVEMTAARVTPAPDTVAPIVQTEPAAVQSPAPAQAAALETGSVQGPTAHAKEASATIAPSPPQPPEAARPEPQARKATARRRLLRRVYRRRPLPPRQTPAEKFWANLLF